MSERTIMIKARWERTHYSRWIFVSHTHNFACIRKIKSGYSVYITGNYQNQLEYFKKLPEAKAWVESQLGAEME